MLSTIVLAVLITMRMHRTRFDTQDRQEKYREVAIRKANYALKINPRDSKALLTLADLYYEGKDFMKAMHTYRLIRYDEDRGVDASFHVSSRLGISAFQAEKWKQAYSALIAARRFRPDNFEVNKYLGQLEFKQKKYLNAIKYLAVALRFRADDIDSVRYLGRSLYAVGKYSKAVGYLEHITETEPEDYVSLYSLACSYYYTDQVQKARDIFIELRHSSEWWGAYSAMYYGDICAKRKEFEQTIESYQLGLSNNQIPEPLKLDLKYKLAKSMIQNRELEASLGILNEIYESSPNYKDVAEQIKHYRQFNSNTNLKIYIMAVMNDFVILCREIVKRNFSGASFGEGYIEDSGLRTHGEESLEMIVKVMINGKEEKVFVKFMRTEGLLGELFVRDLYSRFVDMKAMKCICFSAGEYSSEALNFARLRLIDLVGREQLLEKMKAINLALPKSSF